MLPIIVLIIAPIGHTYLLLTQYWPIFRDGVWEQLTTPGSAGYHQLWGPLLTFEIIGSLVIIVLASVGLVLSGSRSQTREHVAFRRIGRFTFRRVGPGATGPGPR